MDKGTNMLRRFVQILSMTSIFLVSSAAWSGGYCNGDYCRDRYRSNGQGFYLEPSFKVMHETDQDYAHTANDAYVYAGYVFAYRFLNKSHQTITNHTGTAVSYEVEGNTPRYFHSVEAGVGKAISRYVDLQLAYIQQFQQTKNSTISGQASNNRVSMQGLNANLLWIFNPDDQFQVGAKIGVQIADFREKVLLNNVAYYPVDDTTEINPRFGLDAIYQFSKQVALRVGATYTLSIHRVFYAGSLEGFAGLSYKL